MLIYKILKRAEWDALVAQGETAGAPIDIKDGFIHFSTGDQVRETAALHFAGQADLVLAAFEADAFGDALKWETSRGGAAFPHLYGPLRHDNVLWHRDMPLEDGVHVFPDGIA